ncbi:MAG: hypothetical protein LBJ23_02175 [Tannerella sp.]|nr:hypothetical protein [Tannerella sp.]
MGYYTARGVALRTVNDGRKVSDSSLIKKPKVTFLSGIDLKEMPATLKYAGM